MKIINEDNSCLFSKIFFIWTGKFISYVNKQRMVEKPLDIPNAYALEKIETKYKKFWEKHKCTKQNFFKCNYSVLKGAYFIYTCLLIISIIYRRRTNKSGKNFKYLFSIYFKIK